MTEKKQVLVTGIGGLVGRTLAPMLTDDYEVTGFDVQDPALDVPCITGDLRDSEAVAEACQGMDAVIHVAALHGQAWREAGDDTGFEVNVVGTKNVLEGAGRARAERVVFTSSIWATGHGAPAPDYLPIDEDLRRQPAELYGLTKTLGEQMCRYATAQHGMSTICLRAGGIRPADAYGPGQTVYMIGGVDVRDVARAHVLALQAPERLRHEVFVITAESPLCRVDPEAYAEDPVAALDAVVPGVAELVEQGELDVPAAAEFYTVARAARILGYRPEFNFTVQV
jgi:nucleoside-diphosphate-sugar epimerase